MTSAAQAGARPALELDNVTKAFGGLVAVDDVTLRVLERERRAVIGPNGAGKTTLFNLITGALPVTAGRILLFGHDVTRDPVHRRVAAGIGRTYQITNLFPALSVVDNVRLAAQGLSPGKFQFLRPVPRRGELQDRVEQALAAVGMLDRSEHQAQELSHGEQRQLELAVALAVHPKILMLDEPAAGLSAAERVVMFDLIQSLPRDLTLVIIEHDMDLALRLVERVTCLHNGRVVAEDSPSEIVHNQLVQEIYLGTAQ
ncbi:MAG: ABC transporter ATP-binding protein [Chloroflexi bacterium]|nr:ABC transporter ATP-binding protein [Chloroflexota bacterium]